MPILDPPASGVSEFIILDPAEVATGRTELDISTYVAVDGIDWGDAAIEQHLAEASLGQHPVDYRTPNRQIQIPLVLKDVGVITFATIRTNIQAKVGLFQAEGGWLKRVLSNGTTIVFLEVTNAALKLSGGWLQARRSVDIDAVLTLEALPEFYKAEEALSWAS